MAMPGESAGRVDLAWISSYYIPSGETYYIQYSTFTSGVDWSTATTHAQITGTTSEDIPPGSKVDLVVTGLEAGLNAQNQMDSPAYNFKVWITTNTGAYVNEVPGDAASSANTPMPWGNSFIYPNSKLFITNGANNLRNGIAKDSSDNIYTVASFYDYNNNGGTGGGSSIMVKKTNYD
jgi:hypothetical protein